MKERKHNIKLVNSHYAEVNNEMAGECNDKKIKLHVYTTDDGKLWFTIDKSFNSDEMENTHPETSKQDMGKMKHVLNDYRDKDSYLPSEVKGSVNVIMELLKEQSHSVVNITKILESQYKKPEFPSPKRPKEIPDYVG